MGHRKNKTRYYTFLIVPDDEKPTKSIKFSASFIKFLIVVFIILSFGIIIGTVSYWKLASLAADYYSVSEQNQKLKQSLDKVESLKSDLEKIKNMDQKLRNSLSGYVKVTKSAGQKFSDDSSIHLTGTGSREVEKALFNSLPDILPVEGYITRGIEASSFSKNLHLGIDIAAPEGAPIKATADGIVMFSGYTLDEGNVIILKHKDKIFSFYKHNLRNLCSEMEFVKKGQVIALLGNTGTVSSGAHLHFEIWNDYKPVNPLNYIRGADQYLR